MKSKLAIKKKLFPLVIIASIITSLLVIMGGTVESQATATLVYPRLGCSMRSSPSAGPGANTTDFLEESLTFWVAPDPAEAPVPAVSGFARARIQLRHTVEITPETVVPALRSHLASQGFHEVTVDPVIERDMFPPSRTDPEDPWVRFVARSMHETVGRAPNIIPTIGASGPSEFFKEILGVPVLWIPQSYGGCGQHGPDEHGLGSLFRDGLGIMAGVFWDIGMEATRREHQLPGSGG